MELMGQGVVLMIAGMAIVYAFLFLLIWVANGASRLVSRFDHIIPDNEPKKRKNPPAARKNRMKEKSASGFYRLCGLI
jgi:sodium pump decarboxylase gamma subunit